MFLNSTVDNESEINQDQDCGESSEDKQRVEEVSTFYRIYDKIRSVTLLLLIEMGLFIKRILVS